MRIAIVLLLFCGYIHAQQIDPRDVRGTAIVAAPSGTQNITGTLQHNGNAILDSTTGVNVTSSTTQNITQTFPTSLNATAVNGFYNEEFFTGATVNHRIAAAMTACGTVYNFICNILIPPYAPVDSTTMPESTGNNIMIIDQRNVNGQGIFQGDDIRSGCTPFTTCSSANLPGLKGNLLYTIRFGANDPSDSINQVTESQVLGCSITSNVATCTTSNPNSFTIGESVYIGGMTSSPFINNVATNTPYVVLSTGLSATQFEFNFTHANIAFTADTGITGVLCTFCGKNVFNIAAYADNGVTHTNGSDGSVQAGFFAVTRASTSSRQVAAMNLTANCFLNAANNFTNDFCQGLQINMTNSSSTDPLANGAGIFITAGGGIVGRGIQMTGSGGGSFNIADLIQGYSGFGLSLNGLAGRSADIHIVPIADDSSHEIEGLNAANNTTVWHIDSNGASVFGSVGLPNGATWISSSGAPSGACTNGSLYTSSTGTTSNNLWVCGSSSWQLVH